VLCSCYKIKLVPHFFTQVEVKPYVLDDQDCDECRGMRCGGKFAPFFCANVSCLQVRIFKFPTWRWGGRNILDGGWLLVWALKSSCFQNGKFWLEKPLEVATKPAVFVRLQEVIGGVILWERLSGSVTIWGLMNRSETAIQITGFGFNIRDSVRRSVQEIELPEDTFEA